MIRWIEITDYIVPKRKKFIHEETIIDIEIVSVDEKTGKTEVIIEKGSGKVIQLFFDSYKEAKRFITSDLTTSPIDL